MDLPAVPVPDAQAHRAAVARHAESAVPVGGLGRLAELGVWLAGARGTCPPPPPARPRIVVIAGDHGIADGRGVGARSPARRRSWSPTLHHSSSPVAMLAPVGGATGARGRRRARRPAGSPAAGRTGCGPAAAGSTARTRSPRPRPRTPSPSGGPSPTRRSTPAPTCSCRVRWGRRHHIGRGARRGDDRHRAGGRRRPRQRHRRQRLDAQGRRRARRPAPHQDVRPGTARPPARGGWCRPRRAHRLLPAGRAAPHPGPARRRGRRPRRRCWPRSSPRARRRGGCWRSAPRTRPPAS